jgi:autotransporter-associated beta strand protein
LAGVVGLLAIAQSGVAIAQTTLYRNSLSSSSNLWTNTAGWSVSGTASKATPTTVGGSDTLVFSNFWTPSRLSLAVWLDSADSSTVISGSSGVSQWNDKSGNNRNAIQSTVASRAAYVQNGLNGNPSLQFDGTNDFYNVTTGTIAQPMTVLWAGNSTGPGIGGANDGAYIMDAVTGNRLALGWNANNSSAENGRLWMYGGTGGIIYAPSGTTQAWNAPSIVGAVFNNGSSSTLFTNGASVATGVTGAGSLTSLRLGGRTATVVAENAFAGQYGEYILALGALSTSDRQIAEGYLAWKWGTVASLPADHPYKNAAPTVASDAVYLGGNQTAAGLQFAAGATTLLGGTSGGAAANSLALGADGISMAAGAGSTTIGAASGGTVSLVVNADQSWTNDSASLLRVFNGISRASGDATNRTLTISGSGNTQLDGAITNGGVAGWLGLTKQGAGRLLLSGTSSHSGATTVAAGSLLVNGRFDTSAVTVQSGGLLGGSGELLGGVTVLAGGTLSPGNSPGLLTTSELVLAGATLMEIDGLSPRGGIGGYDGVDVTSGLTYGGSMVIDFGSAITTAFADNTSFNLFDFTTQSGLFSSITTANDGSWYGGLTFAGTGDKWTASKGSQTLEFTHSTGNLVIVPEPGALALAGIGIAAAAYVLRRRCL